MQQQADGVDCGVFAIVYATSLAFSKNPSLCSYNVPLMRQHLVNCLEKEMMYPFPKQDSTKRVLRCKKVNCYSVFIVHVVQYGNMKEKIQWLSLWDVISGSTRSAKKYLVKCLRAKQPISFVKDAAKILPVIASNFLEHLQVNWSINFHHLLVTYITKLRPVLFSLYTACF